MRMPSTNASYEKVVHFGRYLGTQLKQAKCDELAEAVFAVTDTVKQRGRAVEDANEPIQDALAQRDYWDNMLDEAAQNFRLKLAAESLEATKKPPYSQIFLKGKGIAYYTLAPLHEEVNRYQELISRIENNLSSDHALYGTVDTIRAGIDGFTSSSAAVAKARTALAMQRSELDAARDEWEVIVEKTFGQLVVEYGKKKANNFFPRAKRSRSTSNIQS